MRDKFRLYYLNFMEEHDQQSYYDLVKLGTKDIEFYDIDDEKWGPGGRMFELKDYETTQVKILVIR